MNIKEYIQKSIKTKENILNNEDIIQVIENSANEIVKAYKNGNKVLTAGNGGSAADAQHLAGELVVKFFKDRPQSHVSHQILAEDFGQFFTREERRKNQPCEQTLRAVAAPRIGFAARVATAKHLVIGLKLGEEIRNLHLTQRTQETEILNVSIDVLSHIFAEIALKLNGFAVLMVDVRAWHRRFVGTRLIRKGDVTATAAKAQQYRHESQHCRERRVAIQIAFLVELQHDGVECAVDHHESIVGIASRCDAAQSRTSRVDNQRRTGQRIAQQFQGDDRILAAANGDDDLFLQRQIHFGKRPAIGRFNRHEISFGASDAIEIEKLAQSVVIQFLPKRLFSPFQVLFLGFED